MSRKPLYTFLLYILICIRVYRYIFFFFDYSDIPRSVIPKNLLLHQILVTCFVTRLSMFFILNATFKNGAFYCRRGGIILDYLGSCRAANFNQCNQIDLCDGLLRDLTSNITDCKYYNIDCKIFKTKTLKP